MSISTASAAPVLGVKGGVILFIAVIVAFVTESQLTQYVQTTLHYRQPFFMFYLVHSSFSLMFPLHFFYLAVTTKDSSLALLRGLQLAAISQLSSPGSSRGFPTFKFTRLVVCLTLGVTFPALLWFVAITLASISDVTAIWNTNAIFAYLFAVKLFGLRWEARKLLAVTLATVGVVVVVYGGSKSEAETTPKPEDGTLSIALDKPSAPLVGNLLTLVASVNYGLYQVLYKRFAALPSDPEFKEPLYEAIPGEDHIAVNTERGASTAAALEDDAVYPPPLGLYPNLLTSCIGICTGVLLWVFLPVLHQNGIETFRLPPDGKTAACIAIISFTGMVFNAGLMILLATWGPIITSVGSLLTIVLILISDTLFGNGLQTLTVWSLVGSSAIIFAFGVLAYDMFMTKH